MYYQEDNNLVSISNSILKAYGLPTFHPSLKSLDEILKANDVPNRKLCVVLLDGFGSAIQEKFASQAPFILGHKVLEISSVFPPTTVAATTSFLTGLYPMETGWLGWNEKLPLYSLPITMFSSTFIGGSNQTPVSTYNYFPTVQLDQMINQNTNKYKAGRVMGFSLVPETFANLLSSAQRTISKYDFSYIYWVNPDSALHAFGSKDERMKEIIEELDTGIKKLVEDNPDTLFITIADHGHIDTTYRSIYEIEDFVNCLQIKANCLEPRASMYFVKPECLDKFSKILHNNYEEEFDILSQKDILDDHLFGLGKPCKVFDELIGDFMLISKKGVAMADEYTNTDLLSHHAGCTQDEMRINLGVYNSK